MSQLIFRFRDKSLGRFSLKDIRKSGWSQSGGWAMNKLVNILFWTALAWGLVCQLSVSRLPGDLPVFKSQIALAAAVDAPSASGSISDKLQKLVSKVESVCINLFVKLGVFLSDWVSMQKQRCYMPDRKGTRF
jgi:hypothetical protein